MSRNELRTPASCTTLPPASTSLPPATCRCPFHRNETAGSQHCGCAEGCIPWAITGRPGHPLYPADGGHTTPLCPSCLPKSDGPSPCYKTWTAARKDHPRGVPHRDPPALHTDFPLHQTWFHQAPDADPDAVPAPRPGYAPYQMPATDQGVLDTSPQPPQSLPTAPAAPSVSHEGGYAGPPPRKRHYPAPRHVGQQGWWLDHYALTAPRQPERAPLAPFQQPSRPPRPSSPASLTVVRRPQQGRQSPEDGRLFWDRSPSPRSCSPPGRSFTSSPPHRTSPEPISSSLQHRTTAPLLSTGPLLPFRRPPPPLPPQPQPS